MLLKNNFISVDWGTTNLRIRLVSNDKFKIIKEKDYDLGLKKINSIWKEYGDKKQTRQEFIFKKLIELLDDFKINGENIPLVLISGMASSSIGIEELQYTSLPVDLDNPSIAIKEYELNGSSINLISGVKTTKDVIRGEETQLIGLYQSFIKNKNVLVVIPGTHSKHIYCQNGSFIDFETYLTGELFDTITSYTILKESVRKNDFNEKNLSSFISGLEIMKKGNRLTKVLFDIRVNNLFKTSTNDENYY
ncbi:2-dehydro-3-deoxygalactonokinase, partial [Bacteroidota bacterium]|nr:2-dehydro-3-deoxygalactonokinase [Bacteroidota bacterium]